VTQNRRSTLETDVCVWRYAPLVVHTKQEEEEESKRIEIQWLVLLHSLLHRQQHRDKTE